MRRLLFVLLLPGGLLGGWVASAGADLPGLPTLPTVTVPTLPLIPPVPPAPPAPVPPPALPHPPSLPALPQSPGAAPAPATPPAYGSARASGGAAGASFPARRVYALHLSRNWIARSGPRHGRRTVLLFRLGKPALVEFVVQRVWPDCRRVTRFRVHGRKGLNRVRIRPRIGGVTLGPGAYKIRARTLPGGTRVADARLVVVRSASRDEIDSLRGANACGSSSSGQGRAAAAGSVQAGGRGSATPGPGQPQPVAKAPPSRSRGVLGERFTRRAVDAVKGIPLWLYLLVGIAIALLAIAAAPLRAAPGTRLAGALARRRALIAVAGTGALVAATVAFVLH